MGKCFNFSSFLFATVQNVRVVFSALVTLTVAWFCRFCGHIVILRGYVGRNGHCFVGVH